MGKKSKKKSKSNKSAVTSTSSTPDAAIATLDNLYPPYPVPPEDASCWICLDENHSTEDPLVRDCSCRGSAGWGHLNCIIQYARQKSKEIGEGGNEKQEDWTHPFILCHNCHQIHNKRLMVDVANELVLFAQTNIPCDSFLMDLGFEYNPLFYMEALIVKLRCYSRPQIDPRQMLRDAMSNKMVDLAREGIKLGTEMFSIIDRMKQHSADLFDSPSIMVKITRLEACVHSELGNLYMMTGKMDDVAEMILIHFKQYRDLSVSIGDSANVQQAELKITMAENTFGFSNKKMDADQISLLRERHKQRPDDYNDAMSLVIALSMEGYSIESQRLTSKFLAISRRVNGPNNETTKNWERMMGSESQRMVYLVSGGRKVRMEAIGYEHNINDGEQVILRKLPKLNDTTKDEQGATVSARADEVTFIPGTPVICHGLVNASHLNGKIGDARKFDCNTKRYEVHFEDASLKPCSVKSANLRILFELPPE